MDDGTPIPDPERCPNCRRFYCQVQRDFRFLFEQYGFRLIHFEDGEQHPICLLVLESTHCRIRLINDRGVPEICIGTKAAPLDWGNPGQAVQRWQDLAALVDFLEGRAIQAPFLALERAGHQTMEERLLQISSVLRTHSDLIFDFMRQEVFGARCEEFACFVAKRKEEILRQIRAKYPGQL